MVLGNKGISLIRPDIFKIDFNWEGGATSADCIIAS